MASIAITGATGRLGRCFLSDPEWKGRHELTGFSRTADGDAIRAFDELTDPAVIAGFDTVLHLAWSTVPKTAEENPDQAASVDLPLLQRLLDSAAAAGKPSAQPLHVVFFSTGAVYGNAPRDRGSVETDDPAPIGAYARGKWEAERLVGRFANAPGLRTTILRVSNAWGFPGNAGTPQGVIPHLIRAAIGNTTFMQWGGDVEKDYLHVDDLSRALLALFELPSGSGLFNLAAGRSYRLGEVIAIVEAITGSRIQVEPGEPLPWDVSRNRLSADHFRGTTGWKPQVSFENGIARLMDEIRSSM